MNIIVARLSTNLDSILLTQPCDTFNCLDISHGRVPFSAKSTINFRMSSGNGRPLTNAPPNWFTPFSVTPKKFQTKKKSQIQNPNHFPSNAKRPLFLT